MLQVNRKPQLATISVYVDGNGGSVYEYTIPADPPEKAREHADQIIRWGYRHNGFNVDGDSVLVFIPPHRIFKVVVSGLDCPTTYPDTVRGT